MIAKIKKEISSILKMFSVVDNVGRRECVFVVFICLISSLMYPLLLELNYRILSEIENKATNNVTEILILIVATVIVSAIFQITNFSNLLLFEKMQINVGSKLMNRIFNKVKFIPHSYFDNVDNVAKLKRIVMFSQDSMLTQNVVHTISMLCNFISLIVIFPVVYRAGIEVFFLILAVSIISNMFNFDEGYLRWEHQTKMGKSNIIKGRYVSYFFDKDVLLEMRMLNSFENLQSKWKSLDAEIYRENIDFEKKISTRKLLSNIVVCAMRTLPVLYVSWRFSLGNLDIAIVFLVWQIQGQFNGIMEKVFNEYKAVHYSVPYIDELCEFLDLSEKKEGNQQYVMSDEKTLIQLENVSFAYTNEDYVLKDINLQINQGEKIAIIGPNGAGKTTLVKMLSKLYKPTKGNILFSATRSNAGAVWQDYVNFELTLKESIGLGDTGQIGNVDQMHKLIDDLKLDIDELELDDIIGRSFEPDGKIPSGGQWQKIAIGRAIFGDKTLLFMDEPTSSLDPISEVNLYASIKELFSDKTLIFVSHRIGFANLADRIIVVNEGRVVEDGTHEELMKNKDYYYHFYNEQIKWYKR